jgi:hypothetical protein
MPSRPSAKALAALGAAAAGQQGRARAASGSVLEVAARRVFEWVRSRPDLADPIPREELRGDCFYPCGTPVLVDDEVHYLALSLDGGVKVWGTGRLTGENPLDLLLVGDPSDEEVLHRARMLITIQLAADGQQQALLVVLHGTYHSDLVELVQERGDGWEYVPEPGGPTPRGLLEQVFSGDQYAWERTVLEEACFDPIPWPGEPIELQEEA